MTYEDGQGNNTMKYQLPDPADPGEYICCIVRVPKSKYHITAFKGAIYDLSLWWNWEKDDAHIATIAAHVWRDSFYKLQFVDCNAIQFVGQGGSDCEDECMCCLRWKDGTLQILSCGQWVDVPGIPPGSTQGGQPGVGSPQPAAGGGQACYNLVIPAIGQALIPTLFNTGDQVIVQDANGAVQDNAALWWTPDGSQFILGASFDNKHTDAADPFPTLFHGALLLVVAGHAFYAYAGQTITIPPGVTNQPAVLRPNLAIAGGNGGSFSANVCAVNNQAARWSHDFDFTISPFGSSWSIKADAGLAGTPGAYIPGVGYKQALVTEISSGRHIRVIELLGPAITNMTLFRITFSYAAGSIVAGINTYSLEDNNVSFLQTVTAPALPTSPLQYMTPGAVPHGINPNLLCGDDAVPDPGGDAIITAIHIEGTGADPF